MNERLVELMKQADRETLGETDSGVPYIHREFDVEKFAELIVRECGQYLNSPEFIGRSDLDWAMVLNEYFGVKE